MVSEWKQKALEVEKLAKENEMLKSQLKAHQEFKLMTHTDLSIPQGSLTRSRNNSLFLKSADQLDLAGVKYYLKQGAYINFHHPDNGATALVIAIAARPVQPELAKLMIMMLCDEYRIDVNIKTFPEGHTALHIAAAFNDEWAIEYLLSQSADPLILNQHKQTPHQWALNQTHWELSPLIHEALLKTELECKRLNSSTFFTQPQKVSKERSSRMNLSLSASPGRFR